MKQKFTVIIYNVTASSTKLGQISAKIDNHVMANKKQLRPYYKL